MLDTPITGHRFRLTFDYAAGLGTGNLTVAQGSDLGTDITTLADAATSTEASVDFIGNGIETRLSFKKAGTNAFLALDNVYIFHGGIGTVEGVG